jgi:hypothetical protein
VGYFWAFEHPIKFIKTAGLLLNVFAILIGLLLAIYSLLINPKRSSNTSLVEKTLRQNNKKLLLKLNILFNCYYISLILAIILTIAMNGINIPLDIESWHRWIVMIYGIFATFTLLWSATLPSLLKMIKERDFNI